MNFDIAVCIPSKNENSTIVKVTTTIDRGLSQYYPELKCVIINIDSNSNDETRQLFIDTPTNCKKISILASKNGRFGKGVNLHQFLLLAGKMNVKCGATIDADLESINEEWIQNLVEPILSKKADFITPLYSRHKYDATITNHLCRPIIFSKWKALIYQPIGGEFSFSQKYIQSVLNELNKVHLEQSTLSNAIDRFGIDIFLTIHAIANNFKIYQAYLGQKIHRFREICELKGMFLDVATALFQIIPACGNVNTKQCLMHPPQQVISPLESSLHIDFHQLSTLITEEVAALSTNSLNQYLGLINLIRPRSLISKEGEILLTITPQEWVVILQCIQNRYSSKSYLDENIEALYPLFLARLASHFSTIGNLRYAQAESLIQQQAQLMRQ